MTSEHQEFHARLFVSVFSSLDALNSSSSVSKMMICGPLLFRKLRLSLYIYIYLCTKAERIIRIVGVLKLATLFVLLLTTI
jgi:hypothetical protein